MALKGGPCGRVVLAEGLGNSQSNQSLWLLGPEINRPWSTRVTDAFRVPNTAPAGKGREESEPLLCSPWSQWSSKEETSNSSGWGLGQGPTTSPSDPFGGD